MFVAPHAGVAPPLVVGPDSRVELSVEPGYGGIRCELDGQELATPVAEMTVSLRGEYATPVELHEEEPRESLEDDSNWQPWMEVTLTKQAG